MGAFYRTPLVLLLACAVGLVGCGPGEDELDEGLETEGIATEAQGMAGNDSDAMDRFSEWDVDADGSLTEMEFDSGWDEVAPWEDWDSDGDGFLGQDELSTAFGDEPWYSDTLVDEWDTDGDDLIGEDELSTGLYHTWAGDDAALGEDEFDAEFFR